jgi:NNP family nitrate/nitrite transporter-like MFS transporter
LVQVENKATRIDLFSLGSPQMRAFHMSWFAFFLCFFAWFGIAPLMAIVRDELGLTKAQIGNTIIASVLITIVARLLIGWLCDKIGPRLCYTVLLLTCSLPVMGIGFAQSYESFLLFRLGIGAIGAAFVITQYHTSVMFAPNCVGTANATSAGWGNLGGGVTQMVMPMIFAAFVAMGYSGFWSWRLSMVVAGGVCFLTGIAYYFFTTDLPDGNYKELRAAGKLRKAEKVKGTFVEACKDYRVWALFLVYAACFGVELTINNIAAIYFKDYFNLSLTTAGLVAGLFGLMNIFARTTGGIIGDRFAIRGGLKGRVRWLFIALIVEAIALIVFSRMTILPIAIGTMIVFSLFVQMSEGATFSVVPFINKRALGSVAGIVGAGGNAGAVAAGFLFKSVDGTPRFLLILGCIVFGCAFAALLVRFSPEEEKDVNAEFERAVAARRAMAAARKPRVVPALLTRLRAMEPLKNATGLDFLRVYLGGALVIKGIYFVMNLEVVQGLTSNMGALQTALVWYVVGVHIVGGACLAIGLATRVSAFFNATVLAGAVLFVHSGEGLFAASQGMQFSLLVLAVLIAIVWRGSGSLSLDHVLRLADEVGDGGASSETGVTALAKPTSQASVPTPSSQTAVASDPSSGEETKEESAAASGDAGEDSP